MKSKPTTEQIAHLCAVISTKCKDPIEAIAARAVDIWLAAESEIESRFQKNYTAMVLDEIKKMRAQFPAPKSYPVNHDDFGKLMLPKLDTGERARVFRQLANGDQCAYTTVRAASYPDEISYLNEAKRFTHHYKIVNKQSISTVRSASAKRRWSKKKL